MFLYVLLSGKMFVCSWTRAATRKKSEWFYIKADLVFCYSVDLALSGIVTLYLFLRMDSLITASTAVLFQLEINDETILPPTPKKKA